MAMREYRKGNWTVEETMILIEAKKKDDERRKIHRSSKQQLSIGVQTPSPTSTPTSSGSGSGNKAVTELRWKWVEEYCWGKGCFRSQNQCNDKWDNLMRDYKKVRDYQKFHHFPQQPQQQQQQGEGEETTTTTTSTTTSSSKSYWSMDKIERKDKGLPTNMLPQIYQALVDVVETASASASASVSPVVPAPATSFLFPPLSPQQQQQPVLPALRISPPPPMSLPPPPPQPQPSPALEAETSGQQSKEPAESSPTPTPSPSPAKRRRKEGEGEGGGEEGTTTAARSSEVMSIAIGKISEAIEASEAKQERRHKEMMSIQESRLRVEESNLEVNRQGLHGLTDAINRLATSIFTWANSHKNQQG